jgi:hypothetical protein
MRGTNTPTRQARWHARGGYAALLSMLFLVLFSTLAIGFYSSTGTAVATAENDRRVAMAQQAAESGMDLMRYELAHVMIPVGTPPSQVISVLATQLGANMNATRNMGTDTVGFSNNVIYIPSAAGHSIPLDSGGQQRFAITITAWGSDIVVKSTGTFNTSTSANKVARSITMDFTCKPIPTESFDYGIASKGQITVSKGSVGPASGAANDVGALMSDQTTAGAITMAGGSVSGDLNLLAGATANITAGSVAGVTDIPTIQSQHVHVVSDPTFPTVDTTVYAPYATNNYAAGAPVQQNIVIPPGTNPRFNAGDEVDGIMYVKSPNTVTFRGNFKLNGFIVFENAGSSATNTLDFRGSVIVSPLPAGSQFDAMRSVIGVAVLAPTTAVSMSGSADSSIKGNVIAGSFAYNGSSTLYVDHGTLMALNTGANAVVVNTTKSILFTATGETNQPSTGMVYPSYFSPKPSTYQEILP